MDCAVEASSFGFRLYEELLDRMNDWMYVAFDAKFRFAGMFVCYAL